MIKKRKPLSQLAEELSEGTKATILMVDDADYLLPAACRELEHMGYFAMTAVGLRQGLEMARECPFDLLITDKNLGRQRGVVPLLDYMKEEKPHVPVLIFSGEDGKQARKELYCHGFAVKSADKNDQAHYRAEIRRLLRNPPYPVAI
jgi:DNA-binding NtrC family response regulator